jgi:hypothetical protein
LFSQATAARTGGAETSLHHVVHIEMNDARVLFLSFLARSLSPGARILRLSNVSHGVKKPTECPSVRVCFVCVFFVQKESLCRWEIFFFRNRNPLENRHTNTLDEMKTGSPTTTKHTTEHHQIHTHTHIHTLCGKSLYLSSRILSKFKKIVGIFIFWFFSDTHRERERER